MESQTLSALHARVTAYKMPASARQLAISSNLLLLCGVTASGKNTISNYLVQHGGFETVVSHTTRQPRANHGLMEKNGVEYWFVTPEEMLELVNQQAFLEVKAVHGETVYGTSISSVQKAVADGKRPVMEIDVQGALELSEAVPGLKPVFILPPSFEIWMERLGTRGALTDGERERRMRSASMELQTALTHPAFILTVNHDVHFTATDLMKGMSPDSVTQGEVRQLAQELLQYVT